MRARAVCVVHGHQGPYETQSAAVAAIAPKIGYSPETLKIWVRQAVRDSGMRDSGMRDSGMRDGARRAERERIKDLEREVKQLRQVEPWKRHWSE